MDEAGRGPLAGPVVAAAVILAPGGWVEGARDSKVLSTAAREELYARILEVAVSVGIGAASPREIDRVNILVATARAMARALARLRPRPDHVVVDGLPMRGLAWEHEAIIGGDASVHSIACASIVAKVCRDRLMRRLASRYPPYGWIQNVGYGTADHREALRLHGPTPHHRLTFTGLQLELEL